MFSEQSYTKHAVPPPAQSQAQDSSTNENFAGQAPEGNDRTAPQRKESPKQLTESDDENTRRKIDAEGAKFSYLYDPPPPPSPSAFPGESSGGENRSEKLRSGSQPIATAEQNEQQLPPTQDSPVNNSSQKEVEPEIPTASPQAGDREGGTTFDDDSDATWAQIAAMLQNADADYQRELDEVLTLDSGRPSHMDSNVGDSNPSPEQQPAEPSRASAPPELTADFPLLNLFTIINIGIVLTV